MSDEEVSNISKERFKNIVKNKAKEITIEYLENLKKKKSKSKQLDIGDLTTSPYLTDSRINKDERELLFKLRSKTVYSRINESFIFGTLEQQVLFVKIYKQFWDMGESLLS